MRDDEIAAAVKDKVNYGSIVTYFQTQNTLSLDQLSLLIDMIEQMSPEIYEHYRSLQDIFRREVRKKLEASPETAGEKLALILKKGCSTGTLLEEKYAPFYKTLHSQQQ